MVREVLGSPGWGVLTYLAQRGCSALMGCFFTRNSLNMGPVFYQKILKNGSTFLTEPNFTEYPLGPGWGRYEIKTSVHPPRTLLFELNELGYSPSTSNRTHLSSNRVQGQLTDHIIHDDQSTILKTKVFSVSRFRSSHNVTYQCYFPVS